MNSVSREKMLHGSIPKLILILSIPAVISNLISNIYNLVDTFFVSSLGISESGATGVIFTLMAIFQAISFMLGQGAGTIVSRRLAVKNNKNANAYASISFISSIIIGLLFLIFGLIFLKPLCLALGSTDTVLPYAMDYGKYILMAAPAIMSSIVLNNILRYEGKTFLGMIGLTIGAITNIALDPICMYTLNLGIAGAGLATMVSQYLSLFILLILFIKKSECKLIISNVKEYFKVFASICKNGMPSLVRQGLNSISSGTLNHFAGLYGDYCLSAISIANRITGFLVSIGIGIGQGFQPVAGFNYEVKKYDRLKQAFNFMLILSVGVFVVSSLICLFFSTPIMDLFTESEKVIDLGSKMLLYTSIGLLFLPVSAGANMLFQSTGKSFVASFLACLRNGLCFIPCLVGFYFLFNEEGIVMATGIADILAGVISLPFIISYFKNLNKNDVNDPLIEK